MGCNCKNISENAAKYSDDGNPVLKHLGWLGSILAFVVRLITSIFTLAVIIVILPLFLLYAAFCLITGKSVNINIKKILKSHGKRK